jgi:hypothetical protein
MRRENLRPEPITDYFPDTMSRDLAKMLNTFSVPTTPEQIEAANDMTFLLFYSGFVVPDDGKIVTREDRDTIFVKPCLMSLANEINLLGPCWIRPPATQGGISDGHRDLQLDGAPLVGTVAYNGIHQGHEFSVSLLVAPLEGTTLVNTKAFNALRKGNGWPPHLREALQALVLDIEEAVKTKRCDSDAYMGSIGIQSILSVFNENPRPPAPGIQATGSQGEPSK